MAKKLKVLGKPGLERDSDSKAIINSDTSAYKAFKMQRSAVKAQIKNVDDMTASQMAMQAEIKDLKKNLNKMMKLVESLTPKDKV